MKAIVTGHSRGIGQALAGILLDRGATVLGLSRSRGDDLGERLRHHALDLTAPEAVAAILGKDGPFATFLAEPDDGPLLLINNAGTVDPMGPVGTLDPAAIARAVAVNVTAPLMLSDAFVAATTHAADRRILHISSGAGRKAYPGWSIYCASKAALDHHASSVGADAQPGLRIASVAPGVVDTGMQASMRAMPVERFVLRERFVGLKETGGLTPPGQAAARLVDYLLSPQFGEIPVTDLRDLPR